MNKKQDDVVVNRDVEVCIVNNLTNGDVSDAFREWHGTPSKTDRRLDVAFEAGFRACAKMIIKRIQNEKETD